MDDEPAINAFVAGYRPTEAVLVVTRGALERFNRDQLQGVVGHEYSHMFNGDMRINIRLIGILAGILLIGQIGRFMLRSSGRRHGSSSNKGGGQTAMLGLALFIIGYIGLFFGSLIKASISRQREFLADASSVQFTRNPSGIAGALWKIQQHSEGSLLDNAHSEDLSHLCFGESVSAKLFSMMATHPPLDVRIKAIDSGFIAKMKAKKATIRKSEPAVEAVASVTNVSGASTPAPTAAINATVDQVVQNIGSVSPAHLGFAVALLAAIPDTIQSSLHRDEGARHLIYAMLLIVIDEQYRDKGRGIIREAESETADKAVLALAGRLQSMVAKIRLPLINMALPALKAMPLDTRKQFLITVEALIKADKRFTIYEFALLTILQEHLGENASKEVPVKYFKFKDVEDEIELLLSVMVRTGMSNEESVHSSYQRIMKQFTPEEKEPKQKSECRLSALNSALHKLNRLAPLLKQSVIQACADCVIYDGKVLPREAELLQVIAVSLDCPMPPLLD